MLDKTHRLRRTSEMTRTPAVLLRAGLPLNTKLSFLRGQLAQHAM